MTRAICAAVVGCLLGLPVVAQTITDGDTIKKDGITYRLFGIDAPESKQICADGWPAGIEATKFLAELIAGRAIECEFRSYDRYGRSVAVCRADGRDLGASMVGAGMAYAFIRYSVGYLALEKAAINSRLGIHAHDCEKPWDWRANTRRQP